MEENNIVNNQNSSTNEMNENDKKHLKEQKANVDTNNSKNGIINWMKNRFQSKTKEKEKNLKVDSKNNNSNENLLKEYMICGVCKQEMDSAVNNIINCCSNHH